MPKLEGQEVWPVCPTGRAGLTSWIKNQNGGPACTFLKPQAIDNLLEDLILLYTRLVNLGMEYRDGKVYLADLEEGNV